MLPLAALALMLAGPLFLLPYRKFDDCLDGVVFGAACGSTLLAAEAIANSSSLLHIGFRVAGDQSLWIARLLTLGVTIPVLGAGVAGATCGAFWLRLRAPATEGPRARQSSDRRSSPCRSPVPRSSAPRSPSSISATGRCSRVTAVLAAGAIVWLRWTIQLGLRQESEEKPVGPPIECPSCRHETPLHTFCGNCGIGLRALPKQRAPHGAVPPGRLADASRSEARVFGALGGAAVGIAAVAIALGRPSPPGPQCEPGVPCGNAAELADRAAAHDRRGLPVRGEVDERPRAQPPLSEALGCRHLRQAVARRAGRERLGPLRRSSPCSSCRRARSPASALAAQLQNERNGSFLGVDSDGSDKHAILSPEVGYVHGIAGMYHATVDQPPSPSKQVELAFMAARHGAATVVIEAITNEDEQSGSASSPFPAFQAVDSILESFAWGVPPT